MKIRNFKSVTCPDCGSERIIRSDSTALLCRQCSGKRNSKPGQPRPKRIRGVTSSCAACGARFWKRPSDGDRRFCSSVCGTTARRRADKSVKIHARAAANNAVRDGLIARMPCQVCGRPKAQMHHEDYSKPLDVRWLCFPCHTELHVSQGDLRANIDRDGDGRTFAEIAESRGVPLVG